MPRILTWYVAWDLQDSQPHLEIPGSLGHGLSVWVMGRGFELVSKGWYFLR